MGGWVVELLAPFLFLLFRIGEEEKEEEMLEEVSPPCGTRRGRLPLPR